jgi:hypothetical protein
MARAGPSNEAEEAISCGVDLDSSEDRELPPHCASVFREQLSPSTVAEFDRSLGCAGDVREEHGREHAIGHART